MKKMNIDLSVTSVIRNKTTFIFEVLIGVVSFPIILLALFCGYEVFIEVKSDKK